MSPETREQKRERLWREFARFTGKGVEEDLLATVEASELKAAEEARASERDKAIVECASLVASWHYKKGGYGELSEALLALRAAPPSPEPERASFPNERFETQSGNLPPLTWDWTPKPREPEALTERGFRQIGEAHNALVARVEALEGTVAGIPEARARELERRVEALEAAARLVRGGADVRWALAALRAILDDAATRKPYSQDIAAIRNDLLQAASRALADMDAACQ